MENTDSNIKPQQTGGLKLMTVFVVVLVLHVVVIGSMTTYYMLKGGSTETDLLSDKGHKGLKANADGTLVAENPAADSTDKNIAPATTTPDTSSSVTTPTPSPAPAPEQTAMADTSSTPAPSPAPTITPVTPPTPVPVETPQPVPATTLAAVPTNLAPPTETTTTPATTVPAASGTTPSVATTDGTPYVVKSRDSLEKIAHQNHTTVAKLKAANSLTSDKLSIGQKLVIPAKTVATAAPAPATPDTAAPASTTAPTTTPAPTPAKTTADKMAKAKPAPAKTTESVATAKSSANLDKASSDHHLYTIVKGDTLTKIAHKFKTTPGAIMAANNITDPTKLTIGKKLTIPSKEAHTAKLSEPATVQPAQVDAAVKSVTTQVDAKAKAAATDAEAKAKAATAAQLANVTQ